MTLKSIRRALARELMTKESISLFDNAKKRIPELAGHETVMSVLAILDDESPHLWKKRDRLVRALIREQRRRPRSFWNAVLIRAFYPMLSRLRHRLVSETLTKAELDQLVLTAFLNVVNDYKLGDTANRTCMLVRQETQRLVFRLLRLEQLEQEVVRPVNAMELRRRESDLADLLAGGDSDGGNPLRWPETSPPGGEPLSESDQARLTAFLVACAGEYIEQDRLALVIARHIRGEKLSHVVRRLYPELSGEDRRRTYQRIKRRHSRALVKLRELLTSVGVPDDGEDALPMRSRRGSGGGIEQ
jgi:hypothetical protein